VGPLTVITSAEPSAASPSAAGTQPASSRTGTRMSRIRFMVLIMRFFLFPDCSSGFQMRSGHAQGAVAQVLHLLLKPGGFATRHAQRQFQPVCRVVQLLNVG